jgi:Skp family chaperone for outer membrane proteins
MQAVFRGLVTLVAGVALVAGCAHEGDSGVAILDLTAVAKATGQDEVIRIKAEATRNELMAQLQQLAQNLDQQLAAEVEKIGDKPTAEQQQFLQQLNVQARNQLAQVQQQAQEQANQIEQSLISEFTGSITPLAVEIAKSRGAKVILAQDAYLFWYDPSIDITGEVIAAWRARPAAAETAEKAAVEGVAEAQAELEEVAEELAETEEELAEVEKQIEVLEEVIEDVLDEEAAATK